MASDSLREVGRYIGKTGRDADRALKRAYPIQPRLERIRDVFDPTNDFEMSFETTQNDERVTLDLFFRFPPPSRGCTVGTPSGCWHSICESFAATSGANSVTVSHPYYPGTVSVFAPSKLDASAVDEISPATGEVGFYIEGGLDGFPDGPGLGDFLGGTWEEITPSVTAVGGIGIFQGDAGSTGGAEAYLEIPDSIEAPYQIDSFWTLADAESTNVLFWISSGIFNFKLNIQYFPDVYTISIIKNASNTPVDGYDGLEISGSHSVVLSFKDDGSNAFGRVVSGSYDSGWVLIAASGFAVTSFRASTQGYTPTTTFPPVSLLGIIVTAANVPTTGGTIINSATVCYIYNDCAAPCVWEDWSVFPGDWIDMGALHSTEAGNISKGIVNGRLEVSWDAIDGGGGRFEKGIDVPRSIIEGGISLSSTFGYTNQMEIDIDSNIQWELSLGLPGGSTNRRSAMACVRAISGPSAPDTPDEVGLRAGDAPYIPPSDNAGAPTSEIVTDEIEMEPDVTYTMTVRASSGACSATVAGVALSGVDIPVYDNGDFYDIDGTDYGLVTVRLDISCPGSVGPHTAFFGGVSLLDMDGNEVAFFCV